MPKAKKTVAKTAKPRKPRAPKTEDVKPSSDLGGFSVTREMSRVGR